MVPADLCCMWGGAGVAGEGEKGVVAHVDTARNVHTDNRGS